MKNDILSIQGKSGFPQYLADEFQHKPAQDWQAFTILVLQFVNNWNNTGMSWGTDKTVHTSIDISKDIRGQIDEYIEALAKLRTKKYINYNVRYQFISASYTDHRGIIHEYL